MKKHKGPDKSKDRGRLYTDGYWPYLWHFLATLAAMLVFTLISNIVPTINIDLDVSKSLTPIKIHVVGIVLTVGLLQFFKKYFLPSPIQGDMLLENVFKQFIWGWKLIWLSWLSLYIWLWIWWADFLDINNSTGWAIADVLNILNGMVFFYLFLVLDKPSVATSEDKKRNVDFRRALAKVIGVCLVVSIFSVLGRLEVRGFSFLKEIGPILLSMMVAISMSYCFGRLDSHYLNIRRWMLAPLYFFVAMQVIWPLFQLNPDYMSAAFYTGFALKCYLFWIITYWIRIGAFKRYFILVSAFHKKQMDTSVP